MRADVIRDLNRTVPFKPYEIRTNAGERLPVPHPDFILVSQKGTWVIVTDENEHSRYIDTILIEEISPLRKRRRGRSNRNR